MIITAKVAKKQANKTSNNLDGVKNSVIRELRQVEIAINRNSKKGKKSLSYPSLSQEVKEVLKKNGYTVHERSNYDYEWIVIEWDETT